MFYDDVNAQALPKCTRILIVCAAGYVYGKEAVTFSLIEGLIKRGHEVMVITSTWTDGKFEDELERSRIPNEQLPLGFISKRISSSAIWMTVGQLRRLPGLWIGYRRCVRRFEPDVVLHSNFHHLFLLLPALAKGTNIFHVHDSFAPKPFYRLIFRLINFKIRKFVAVSEFVAITLTNLGLPKAKIRCVLNGVNEEAQGQSAMDVLRPSITEAPRGAMRIGIVGQVVEWKGHQDLIEALSLLRQKGEAFLCRIFGDDNGSFAARLRLQIEERGLTENVEWVGFVRNKSLIYRSIDVCVVPSRFQEPFGMVAAEAAFHGLPVIATKIGGLPEVVRDGETGYLVDVACPEQVAEKLSLLSASPERRFEMGRRAKANAEARFGREKMISGMEAVFTEIA